MFTVDSVDPYRCICEPLERNVLFFKWESESIYSYLQMTLEIFTWGFEGFYRGSFQVFTGTSAGVYTEVSSCK